MVFKDEPFSRMDARGLIFAGKSLFCNLCNKKTTAADGYFRCNNPSCDYDVCFDCGYNMKDLDMTQEQQSSQQQVNHGQSSPASFMDVDD